jgi:hypothetical protein
MTNSKTLFILFHLINISKIDQNVLRLELIHIDNRKGKIQKTPPQLDIQEQLTPHFINSKPVILYTDKWFLTFSAFKDGKWPIIFPHI